MANTPVTSLRIPDDVKAWAQKKADADHRSLGNWIVTALRIMKEADERQDKKRK